MIEPPSEYELAVAEARSYGGGISHRVYCREHGGEVGVIRFSPHGPLFSADVPVEAGSGAAEYRRRLQKRTGERPPPVFYEVRVLVDRMSEADDPPKAWCEKGGHRIFLDSLDFGPHSGKVRVKPV